MNPLISGRSAHVCTSLSSKRQSSTRDATSEKSEKLVPLPLYVAPSGYGVPGHTFTPAHSAIVVPDPSAADLGTRVAFPRRMRHRNPGDHRCTYLIVIEQETLGPGDLCSLSSYLSGLSVIDCDVVVLDGSPLPLFERN